MNIYRHPQYCIRCGTCCKKGGPVLHTQDRDLIQSGILRPEHLMTLRQGELAYHPVEDKVIALTVEMIKISSVPGTSTCIFYDEDNQACTIYENRPVECRALKCWDTSDIDAILQKHLLVRTDLCPETSLAGRLISGYEKKFPAGDFYHMMQDTKPGKDSDELLSLISTDSAFRSEITEKLKIQEKDLKFFFGRSLEELAVIFFES
ncbi:MAG TPA: YkgJ family cysteine cluster protein [Thermodesulfobacteriaceae bacterium]|nr:YkgJ family cysteine cluster protein [Thermodesulfobacteriaceae bacterium]